MISVTNSPKPTLQLADWTKTMSRSILRQMIAVVSQPGILSFAGGLPDPALFPAREYAQALTTVLAEDPRALQYMPPYPRLKTHIVQMMAQRGVQCTEDQVFITTGAQQALDVLCRVLINPGDAVILEQTVYTGIQQVLAPFRARILGVPTNYRSGIDVNAVEALLAGGERPAFIYTIPNAHNPLGVTMTQETREQLVAVARRYGVPVIEDDAYGFLRYVGEPDTPMRAMDEEWVFYVGSFSKILAPALRLGWIVAPTELVSRLTVAKEAGDLESSALTQRAVAAYLDEGHFPAHLARLRQVYNRRRVALLAAIERHFPAGAEWTYPQGGMFVWVKLPGDVDTRLLLETAVSSQQVAFIPGIAFAVPGYQANNCLRLTFSSCSVAQIEEGIARLGQVLKEAIAK
ncbi:MAG: PLP-dependent aminotransferase family protein [Chloroflexi bacterium]|nr:MAG: PLP-dependent aminotransferase family protein [Chloroflexota bacterium]